MQKRNLPAASTQLHIRPFKPCASRKFAANKGVIGIVVAILLTLSSTPTLFAAKLAGVDLPDTTEVGGQSLVLNGLGLRTEYMAKIYVAGLYLHQKSSDSAAIINDNSPKQVSLHFLHDASKKQLDDAFTESLSDNSPGNGAEVKADLAKLLGELESVRSGDSMAFTYVPATGTTLAVNGKNKATLPGRALSQAVFSMWLGPKPPTASLKKGMLGQ